MKKIISVIVLITMSMFAFGLLAQAADSEEPIIDLSTLSIDKDTATLGDTVTISVSITDNVAISRAYIWLENENAGNKISTKKMYCNAETGKYEYVMNITEKTPEGVWKITDFMAYDTTGNYKCVFSSTIPQSACFTVSNTGCDSEPPVIDCSTITISKQKPGYGDSAVIAVKATDNVGIDRIYLSLENEAAGVNLWTLAMTYNPVSMKYEYTMEISESTATGIWEVSAIFAYDAINNTSIESYKSIPSTAHFTVVDHAHNYVPATVAPTCTAVGYNLHTCSVCGDDYKDNYVDIISHTEAIDIAVAPDCTNTGLTAGSHCSVCSAVLIAQEVIPALGHSMTDVSYTAPTCGHTGCFELACTACGEKCTTEIPAKGDHKLSVVIDKSPTFDKHGSATVSCAKCEYKIVIVIPELELILPDYVTGDVDGDDNVTTSDARLALRAAAMLDILEKDSKPFICADVDGNSVIDTTDARSILRVAAKLELFCTHNYNASTVKKMPTCFENGSAECVCSLCSIKAVCEIKQLEHCFVTVIDKASSCSEKGITHEECILCKAKQNENAQTECCGHCYLDWSSITEPTCETDGSKAHICYICSHEEKLVIDATGHNYIKSHPNAVDGVVPYLEYTCDKCGDSYTESIPPITAVIRNTGTSSSSITFGSWSQTMYSTGFSVTASGGCGTLQYKYEVLASPGGNTVLLSEDYSANNTIYVEYKNDGSYLNGKALRVTVKDEVGNIKVFEYAT